MSRESMIQIPAMVIASLVLLVILFTGMSYAIPPTIAVVAEQPTVRVSTSTNITVMAYDFNDWELQGMPVPPWDVQLQCSGPGQGTFGQAQGEMDSTGQYMTTFKADKAGTYTVTATLTYIVVANLDPLRGTATTETSTVQNTTPVTVTSSVYVIPGVSYIPPIRNINIFGNATAVPTATPKPSTSAQPTPSPTPTAAATSSGGQQSTPVTTAAATIAAATPTPGPSQQTIGDNSGSTTTYLAIVLVVLIVIVAIMAGYILGNRKK